MTDWSQPGPDFFAGIEICKVGKWSLNAVKSASTR